MLYIAYSTYFCITAGLTQPLNPGSVNINQLNQINQLAALQAQAAQPRPATAAIDPRLQVCVIWIAFCLTVWKWIKFLCTSIRDHCNNVAKGWKNRFCSQLPRLWQYGCTHSIRKSGGSLDPEALWVNTVIAQQSCHLWIIMCTKCTLAGLLGNDCGHPYCHNLRELATKSILSAFGNIIAMILDADIC